MFIYVPVPGYPSCLVRHLLGPSPMTKATQVSGPCASRDSLGLNFQLF